VLDDGDWNFAEERRLENDVGVGKLSGKDPEGDQGTECAMPSSSCTIFPAAFILILVLLTVSLLGRSYFSLEGLVEGFSVALLCWQKI
jgi:hypothetical protein